MSDRRRIYAIDPGTLQSALVVWYGGVIEQHGIHQNEHLLDHLEECAPDPGHSILVIEQIRSYGMAVGAETLDTVFWSGRFAERWNALGGEFAQMPRMDVKMFWCQSARAKDSNVWCAMVDRFGAPGTKKNPGFLFGVKSHERAALALAVAWAEQEKS